MSSVWHLVSLRLILWGARRDSGRRRAGPSRKGPKNPWGEWKLFRRRAEKRSQISGKMNTSICL